MVGSGDPTLFIFISSSRIEIKLYTDHLPGSGELWTLYYGFVEAILNVVEAMRYDG